MNHANLTARYRPQTFADLAGQETVRAILSRAAAEDRVAPAYLFSGTRGVGKTTLARVFAKALNCVRAPAAEPCNECERCRQITLGTAVDVVEIDGASNRGIDDVRRLKEVVGYAPMDGRYKIFIIDEAHMLSRDAFNALLKTLEEPPARVTFIMATTEAHKFPATILSRCQQYVFKSLSEQGLETHLTKILTRESVLFEAGALRLICRRAAGSVRDAMSLLGQVLALGGESLTESDTRRVLGLAGQELLFTLLGHLRTGDSAAIVALLREMLDSGLDLGFFMRELASCWRTMFIIRQAGAAGAAAMNLPETEAGRWQTEAALFDLAHIHAAWQMTLDGQRRVMTSLEPALGLELLLLNIAMLPRLLPLEDLSRLTRAGSAGSGASGAASGQTSGQASGPAGSAASGAGSSLASGAPAKDAETSPTPSENIVYAPAVDAQPAESPIRAQTAAHKAPAVMPASEPVNLPWDTPAPRSTPAPGPASESASEPVNLPWDTPAHKTPPVQEAEEPVEERAFAEPALAAQVSAEQTSSAFTSPEDTSWEAFLRFCGQQNLSKAFLGMIRSLNGEFADGVLAVTPAGNFALDRLNQPEAKEQLLALISRYYGQKTQLRILPPLPVKSPAEIKEELRANPAVRLLEQEMGARIVDYGFNREQGAGPPA